MSKYVKNLVSEQIAASLEGVNDALLVNMIGINANSSVALRRELREKGISVLVVKKGLAARAVRNTPLSSVFDGVEGSVALAWGADDFVSLTKEITRIDEDGKYKNFEARGGVMDGEQLTADRVKEISKWPNREEQLSILSGQMLAPGGTLVAQLESPGSMLASQIEKKSEGDGE